MSCTTGGKWDNPQGVQWNLSRPPGHDLFVVHSGRLFVIIESYECVWLKSKMIITGGKDMLSLEQELKENAYPGRGIVIGKSAD